MTIQELKAAATTYLAKAFKGEGDNQVHVVQAAIAVLNMPDAPKQ